MFPVLHPHTLALIAGCLVVVHVELDSGSIVVHTGVNEQLSLDVVGKGRQEEKEGNWRHLLTSVGERRELGVFREGGDIILYGESVG